MLARLAQIRVSLTKRSRSIPSSEYARTLAKAYPASFKQSKLSCKVAAAEVSKPMRAETWESSRAMRQMCMIFNRFFIQRYILQYHIQEMSKEVLVLFISLYLIHMTYSCNASHFDFTSKYTLGKQDQLNRTFSKIQQKLTTIKEVKYMHKGLVTYTISDINLTYFYIDSKQRIELIGNDTIIITGGKLQVDFVFNWTKSSTNPNGTGRAVGLSDDLTFSKALVVDKVQKKFYNYELLDAMPVQFPLGTSFGIRRLSPPDSTQEDKTVLKLMMDNLTDLPTVKSQLEEQLNKIYTYFLRNYLHDEHLPVEGSFSYTWVPQSKGQQNVTIQFMRTPLMVDVQKDGIYTMFQVFIDYPLWKCGLRQPPVKPSNPSYYGGVQQFISYDFYENVIKYAISKNILNVILNQQNWGNRMFSFNVGDLYEVFPALQRKYYARQQIAGQCKPAFSGFKVLKGTNSTMNVSLHQDCTLYVSQSRQKILDFYVDLSLLVAGQPQATSMDFRIQSYEKPIIKLFPYGIYKLQNEMLALAMIHDSLKLLNNAKVFGSGWPMSPPRDYPQFRTQANYTLVYDSTYVGLDY